MSQPLPTEPVLRLEECIYRTARKTWACKCDCHRAEVHDPKGKLKSHADFCVGEIKPGDRYIEYMGEVAGYGESGTRYCLPCGVAEWSAEGNSYCAYCYGTGTKSLGDGRLYDCPDCHGTGEI